MFNPAKASTNIKEEFIDYINLEEPLDLGMAKVQGFWWSQIHKNRGG